MTIATEAFPRQMYQAPDAEYKAYDIFADIVRAAWPAMFDGLLPAGKIELEGTPLSIKAHVNWKTRELTRIDIEDASRNTKESDYRKPLTWSTSVYHGVRINLGLLREALHDASVQFAAREEVHADDLARTLEWERLVGEWMQKSSWATLLNWHAFRGGPERRYRIVFSFATDMEGEAFLRSLITVQ